MALDERRKQRIRAAVREVDPAQIAIMRRLTPAQRAEIALSMIRAAEEVAVHRLRLQQPELSELAAPAPRPEPPMTGAAAQPAEAHHVGLLSDCSENRLVQHDSLDVP